MWPDPVLPRTVDGRHAGGPAGADVLEPILLGLGKTLFRYDSSVCSCQFG
jgi:hypothetical protein